MPLGTRWDAPEGVFERASEGLSRGFWKKEPLAEGLLGDKFKGLGKKYFLIFSMFFNGFPEKVSPKLYNIAKFH